jgi:hypothetical protein
MGKPTPDTIGIGITTNNYTPKITVTTAHMKPSQFAVPSLVVAW